MREISVNDEMAARVQQHAGLVWMWSDRFSRHSALDREDLFQEGCIGLMAALRRFDPFRGIQFSTYASHWIRYAMRRATHASFAIKIPEYRMAEMTPIYRHWEQLCEELQREPSREELQSRAQSSNKTLDLFYSHRRRIVSFDDTVTDIQAQGDIDRHVRSPRLQAVLDHLSQEDLNLVFLVFVDEVPLETIAKQTGQSPWLVRKRLHRALAGAQNAALREAA